MSEREPNFLTDPTCKLSLQAETVIPNLKQEQQTKAEWYVESYLPYNSLRLNQLIIKQDANTVKAGQTLNLKLQLRTFSQKEASYLKHLSYIVSHSVDCVIIVYE